MHSREGWLPGEPALKISWTGHCVELPDDRSSVHQVHVRADGLDAQPGGLVRPEVTRDPESNPFGALQDGPDRKRHLARSPGQNPTLPWCGPRQELLQGRGVEPIALAGQRWLGPRTLVSLDHVHSAYRASERRCTARIRCSGVTWGVSESWPASARLSRACSSGADMRMRNSRPVLDPPTQTGLGPYSTPQTSGATDPLSA